MNELKLPSPENDLSSLENTQSKKPLSSKELFGNCRELVIEHEGELYRLRITRRNRLILQK